MANATRKLLGHPARACHHRIQIIGNPGGRQTKFLGAVHQMEHFGRPQHGFGRDTAPVQANAAQIFTFDNRNFQPQLRSAHRRHIAARSCPDYDHVKVLGRHVFLPEKSSLALNHNENLSN